MNAAQANVGGAVGEMVGCVLVQGFERVRINEPPPPHPPPPRTNRTRRVPHPVLIGHAASLTPYIYLRNQLHKPPPPPPYCCPYPCPYCTLAPFNKGSEGNLKGGKLKAICRGGGWHLAEDAEEDAIEEEADGGRGRDVHLRGEGRRAR